MCIYNKISQKLFLLMCSGLARLSCCFWINCWSDIVCHANIHIFMFPRQNKLKHGGAGQSGIPTKPSQTPDPCWDVSRVSRKPDRNSSAELNRLHLLLLWWTTTQLNATRRRRNIRESKQTSVMEERSWYNPNQPRSSSCDQLDLWSAGSVISCLLRAAAGSRTLPGSFH